MSFAYFFLTEHQTALSSVPTSLSLLPLLLSCHCSRRLIPLRASPAFHMLIYCQQTHVAFVSALLARLSGRQFSSKPPCSCCHLYIPFLIKVDKCPPLSLLSSLLSTVIEQLLKIDYENRLLKFFTTQPGERAEQELRMMQARDPFGAGLNCRFTGYGINILIEIRA